MLQSIHGRLLQVGLAAAATVLVAAAPAQAETPAASSTTANASGAAQQPARTDARADRRICADVQLSSSRITRRVCRTQAEWARDGGVPGRD